MKKNKEKVLIIGLGYVGLTLAVHLSRNGYITYGVEIDKKIVQSIRNRTAHFYEPGINTLIKKLLNKKLFVSDKVPDLKYDVIIISVGTPLYKGKTKINMEYLKQSLDSIAPVYKKSTLIVLRSTVGVGTTRNIVFPIIKSWSNMPDNQILLSFCPERTAEGMALDELKNLPQLVSGYNYNSLQLAHDFFSKISSDVYKCASLEAAELAKLFNNVYRDVNFAIGNIFNNISQKFGIDGSQMIELANRGYERSKIALPGFVGGPCLEKDSYILVSNMNDSEEKSNIIAFREYNINLENSIISWVNDTIENGSKIIISGIAFKGQPPTSDIRGSNALKIIERLKNNYEIFIHDFYVNESDLKAIENVKQIDILNNNKNRANLLIILNNASKYKELALPQLSNILKPNAMIFDSWSVMSKKIQKQYLVHTLGNYKIDN